MGINNTAATILYQATPPVLPLPMPDMLSAERISYNVKMNLAAQGNMIATIDANGDTDLANFIDILCGCIIKELLNYGFGETLANNPGTPLGPTVEGSPVPTMDTVPADGPGHIHAHTHAFPTSAIKFR